MTIEMNTYEPRKVEIAERSVLYSDIVPIGIGTMYVQSLSNYLETLVEEHHTPWQTFIKEVITPNYGQSNLFHLRPNPPFVNIEKFCSVLAELTTRSDLTQMTMLYWQNVIAAKDLHRSYRAWCPVCLQVQEQKGLCYEPLLWTLEAVTVCVLHEINLVHLCPTCNKKIRFFHPKTPYGNCVYCKGKLGAVAQKTPAQFIDILHTIMISQMIEEAQTASPPPRKDALSQAVKLCIYRDYENQIERLAEVAGVSSSTLQIIAHKNRLPNLKSFVKLNYFQPLSQLVNKEKDDIVIKETRNLEQNVYNKEKTEQALLDCLNETPPITLSELAAKIGLSSRRLRWFFPELSSQIIERSFNHRTGKTFVKNDERDNKIEEKFKDLLADVSSPPEAFSVSMKKVGHCPVWVSRRFPELSKQLKDKYLAYKSKTCRYRSTVRDLTLDEIREKLEDEISVSRVPPFNITEFSNSLGYSSSFLQKRFPHQHKVLCQRYTDYTLIQKPTLEEKIKKTIMDLHESGLYPSIKKIEAVMTGRPLSNKNNRLIWRQMLDSLGYVELHENEAVQQ